MPTEQDNSQTEPFDCEDTSGAEAAQAVEVATSDRRSRSESPRIDAKAGANPGPSLGDVPDGDLQRRAGLITCVDLFQTAGSSLALDRQRASRETLSYSLYEHANRVPQRSPELRLQEAIRLSHALDLEVAVSEIQRLSTPHPATYLSSGQVEGWKTRISEDDLACIVVDASLSPIQHRNLERAWRCEVIDRTRLILEIFAKRARSAEGKIQTRLALLEYQRTRLVRAWTHLERQRGRLSFVGGAGESQLEIDRRLVSREISVLKRKLADVARTRRVQRSSRSRSQVPIVALVGYTNAGKSTLFNQLTDSGVIAEDQLFATLDTTLRKVSLESGGDIYLSDTVGFISNLPTSLIAAFRATLDELHEADMILHVRDVSSEAWSQEGDDVTKTLEALGIGATDPRCLEIWNKRDALSPAEDQRWAAAAQDAGAILCSAIHASSVRDLHSAIASKLRQDRVYARIVASYALGGRQGQVINWLYDRGEIVTRSDTETGVTLEVWVSQDGLGYLSRRWPDCEIEILPLPSAAISRPSSDSEFCAGQDSGGA